MKKVANYNIRFCNVIDTDNFVIDLTPAELKYGLGKILYIISAVYETDGGIQLTCFHLFNAIFSEGECAATFLAVSGGEATTIEMFAAGDDEYFSMST